MKKSNYISIATGLVGVCIGAAVTAIACKKMVEKEVKNAVDEKVKDTIKGNIDTEKLNKEIIDETTSGDVHGTGTSSNIKISNDNIDKKLNNFNERIATMEDIDAKKIDLAKTGILAIVTIVTTLITSYYKNRNNVDENALIKVLKHIDDVGNSNFSEFEKRLCILEAK